MASRQAQKRLTKEYRALSANPPPFITAKPNEEDILEWHYVITGPPSTPFEDGQYHGILRFPTEYPFKPPAISMVTPNGKFSCNTRLCLSISDYHPDTWNPAWSVSTILTGLLSFMTGDETTTGSISTSDRVKTKLASESKQWNNRENVRFRKQFPEHFLKNKQDIQEAALKQKEEQVAKKPDKDAPLDRNNLDTLDAEDRARLFDENDRSSFAFQRFTIFGMIVAAFVAAYFSVLRRG